MSRALSIAALIAIAAWPAGAAAQVQARECLLQYETSSGNTRTNAQKTPSGQYNFFQGGGVTYHCEGQDNTLLADSAEYYGDQKVLYLIGACITPSRGQGGFRPDDVLPDRGPHPCRRERNVRTQTGTTIKGPVMDYYRATPTRPLARTIATGRPTMSIVQREVDRASR